MTKIHLQTARHVRTLSAYAEMQTMDDAELAALHMASQERSKTIALERGKLEDEITRRAGGVPALGHTSVISAGPYLMEVGNKINYDADWKKWALIRGAIPEHLRPTRWIEAIDKGKLFLLRTSEPVVMAVIAQAITVGEQRTIAVKLNVAAPADTRS